MIRENICQQNRAIVGEGKITEYRNTSDFYTIAKDYGVKTDFFEEIITLKEDVETHFNELMIKLTSKSS